MPNQAGTMVFAFVGSIIGFIVIVIVLAWAFSKLWQ